MHAAPEPLCGDFPVDAGHGDPRHLAEVDPPRPLRDPLHLLLATHRVRLIQMDDGHALLQLRGGANIQGWAKVLRESMSTKDIFTQP